MVSIRYPSRPAPVDFAGFERGLSGLGDVIDEKRGADAFGQYLEGLYGSGNQQQPMSLAALAPRQEPVQDVASQRVSQAHNASDPMASYFTAIRGAESGGDDLAKNPNSSATGRYQFTEGTWNDLMRSQPNLGLTPDGRTDPRQQEVAVRALTSGNAKQLSQAGLPVNPGTLYASHFLGAGGAKNTLSQPDQTPMASVVGPEVVQANPFLGEMTVGDFKAWSAQKGGGSPQAAMTGGGASPGVQMPQGAPDASPASLLPPPDVMKALFRSETTRPLAIGLAQSAQALRANQGDPKAQLEYQKALIELQNLQQGGGGDYKVVDDRLIRIGGNGQVSDVTPQGPQAAGSGGFRFDGKSVEAQALNGLMDSGQLTPDQAQQLGAGKTITGPNGEIIFMTPKGVFGQPAGGGPPQPLGGQSEQGGNIQVTAPKITPDEKKAMTFADRMTASGQIIDSMGTAGFGKVDQIASGVPGVGEYLTSDDFKKVDQAKRDFVNAQLRRESGAVISEEEFENANKQYFPQPNDPPEVIEQKRRNRQIVIEGMARDAGPTYRQRGVSGKGNRTSSGVQWSID